MNCTYHPDRPAVSQCKKCGKCFCEECSTNMREGMCPNCYTKFLNERIRQNRGDLMLCSLAAMVAFVYFFNDFIDEDCISSLKLFMCSLLISLFIAYCAAGIVVGWKTLSRRSKWEIVGGNLLGLAIHLFLKMIASCYVGLIALIPFIIDAINQIESDKNMISEIRASHGNNPEGHKGPTKS